MNGELGLLVEFFNPVDEPDRRSVSVLASQKGPGFTNDQVCGEYLLVGSEMIQQRHGVTMSPITG